MNFRQLCLIFVYSGICALTALGAENLQQIRPWSDRAIQSTNRLFLEQGRVEIPPVGEMANQEVLFYLRQLSTNALSATGQRRLGTILSRLKTVPKYSDPAGFAFDTSVNLALEGLVAAQDDQRVWAYGYQQRSPMLKIPLDFWAFDSVYFTGDFEFKNDPFAVLDHPNSTTNLVTDLGAMDFMFPYFGGINLGGEHWNLQLMRAPMAWGVGQTGKLTLSEDAGPLDYLLFTTYWERFKFTTVVVGQDDYAYAENSYTTWAGYKYYNSGDTPPTQQKLLLAHRFDVLPLDNLRLTLNELYIVESDSFDFRYLNPFLIYHNWFLSKNANSDMALEFEWAPLPGLSLYGQWYVDYFKTEFKDKLYSDPTPASFAKQLGFTWAVPNDLGYWTGGGEWVITDPYFYLNNHVNMTVTRRYVSNYVGSHGQAAGSKLYDVPFGYKYGPDTQVFFLQTGWEASAGWKANLDITLVQKGSHDLRTKSPLDDNNLPSAGQDPTTYLYLTTPSGPNPQHELTIHPQFDATAQLWGGSSDLSFGLGVYGIWTWNRDHVAGKTTFDIQTVIGLTWKLL